MVGGDGGSHWTDGSGVNLNGHITAIELRSGGYIDAIRARYGDTWGQWHGGSGGTLHAFELNSDAVIEIVQGKLDYSLRSTPNSKLKSQNSKSACRT